MICPLLGDATRVLAAVHAGLTPNTVGANLLGYAAAVAMDASRWTAVASVMGMANGCVKTNVDETRRLRCRVCQRSIVGTYYVSVELQGGVTAVACRGRCEEKLLAELGVTR